MIRSRGRSIHARNHSGDFFACHYNGDIDLFVGANGIDVSRQVARAMLKAIYHMIKYKEPFKAMPVKE
ncbi:hypothetical protein [Candidatus Manganitrophus noduliformans]|uniref:Uncharacterized protein n=1 Tax=Candidatus Manganitrophus noduliformans TaxID=2606439 RepID=A0A7X6IBC6_9BACT|nr:hypothetical protein [Candidatus Manganitrophus noduliformans]NKE71320.1 hypothetical protein [Candidatus Manganitrophus noduliformans]